MAHNLLTCPDECKAPPLLGLIKAIKDAKKAATRAKVEAKEKAEKDASKARQEVKAAKRAAEKATKATQKVATLGEEMKKKKEPLESIVDESVSHLVDTSVSHLVEMPKHIIEAKLLSSLFQPAPREEIKKAKSYGGARPSASMHYSKEAVLLQDDAQDAHLDKSLRREHDVQPPVQLSRHAKERVRERHCKPGEKMENVFVGNTVVTVIPRIEMFVSRNAGLRNHLHITDKAKMLREAKKPATAGPLEMMWMTIPRDMVGGVIGPGGTELRSIRMRAKVSDIDIEDADGSESEVKIVVRGASFEACQSACDMIYLRMEELRLKEEAKKKKKEELTFRIPPDIVGGVIGKGGEVIERIKEASVPGGDIQFRDGEVIVRGFSTEACERARALITEQVEALTVVKKKGPKSKKAKENRAKATGKLMRRREKMNPRGSRK